MPSFILIHPTVWPQYTNVTERQTGQWSDSIGRTILQMVAQKGLPEQAVIHTDDEHCVIYNLQTYHI